ncbi:hypothetical protein [Chitinophaga sp. XS-30]|uniref:hypothetical protein n=1 Tax=Chitinophaga sp. XS-30 TaxID=2604421 RepID=UPI0011DCB5C1|nr:hypothetical protein [Chitinophaga sp. XS-30]QEH39451.1 hypothetical protein FW415_00610 [Chitinophaga sp. XS-30]
MKKYNILLFLIALGISVVTVASNGQKLGKRTITDCFKNVLLTNGWSTYNISTTDCYLIPYIQSYYPFVQYASIRVNVIDTVLEAGDDFFCATVMETTNSSAPIIDLGEGLRRYELQDIYCVLEDTE